MHGIGFAQVLTAATYYAALGVTPEATGSEIKRAFHRLALKLHPDKNAQDLAEEGFKRAQEAHTTLSDPHLRKEYDHRLRAPRRRHYE